MNGTKYGQTTKNIQIFLSYYTIKNIGLYLRYVSHLTDLNVSISEVINPNHFVIHFGNVSYQAVYKYILHMPIVALSGPLAIYCRLLGDVF